MATDLGISHQTSGPVNPQVLNYGVPGKEPPLRPAHVSLLTGGVVYLAGNVFALLLLYSGAIFPPWGVLGFFSFTGPAVAGLLVVALQVFARPFRWAAVLMCLAVLGAAAAFNVWLMVEVSASV